ncbi:unnamed protein product [Rotaria sordida]|uniref:Uncharacterized protein n=1 Tax=Rotaria sordida TaxID=392033 RepID=A0A819X5W8_9BILA|nr:unnamed protein product [Rotaria sordida]CAF4137052.1 unnamed protein product [Rotaria sordida]
MTTSHMYLVITTIVWMSKTSNRSNNIPNILFGVFGFERIDDIDKFLGEFQGAIMQDVLVKKISQNDETIEEFHFYTSTWKGWQGPLISKDNKITWEQVEHHNTMHETISDIHSVKESIENFKDLYENKTKSSTLVPLIHIVESFKYE